jgi:cold shock CspA family protein
MSLEQAAEQVISDTKKKTLGLVKWFDSRGGFGFITILPEETNAGKDIFVHYSSLSVAQSQYKYLVLGEYVEFIVSSSDNEKYEFSAKEVSGIRGGNLMCESRRLSALETRNETELLMSNQQPRAASMPTREYRNQDINNGPGRRLPSSDPHSMSQGRGRGRVTDRKAPESVVAGDNGEFTTVTHRKRSRAATIHA